MNSTTHGDSRAPALINAEQASDLWRTVVHEQGPATPDHVAFYALAGEVVDTLRCLSSLASLLGRQVAEYGIGRTLRDDEQGRDPRQRLVMAAAATGQMRRHLDAAERAGNEFWSQVGHIAVEYAPELDDATTDRSRP